MSTEGKNVRIDVAAAVDLIDSRMPAYPAESISIDDTCGTILRRRIVAERDQPPFDRVTMDGIAIRAASLAGGARKFRVIGTQAAGAPAISLGKPDNCVEIMTGAMLPADADTVVPVERIRREHDYAVLESDYEPEPGQFIHRQASDHRAGQPLLEPGIRLGPPEAAVLTIAGSPTIEVARWPRVSIISTGDELIDVGGPIEKFQIRSSNDRAIAAALRKRGCSRFERAHLPDDPQQLRVEIARLHERTDLLVLSGGVSMGKYDYVPQIMDELGIELVFHKILQRPGLPMWFGISGVGKPVFALPGNPVSSLVCLIRYVLPAIENAMGAIRTNAPPVRLSRRIEFEPDLTYFLPVLLSSDETGEWHAIPKPTNTSGDFVSLAGTDGFVELARGRDAYPAGYPAPYFSW